MGHNYRKYSEKSENKGMRKDHNPIDEAAVELTQTEEPKTKPFVFGKVANCVKLNVRERPDKNAAVISEIFAGASVVIDEDESTDEFFKVCTEAGLDGFCMKDYIYIDQ